MRRGIYCKTKIGFVELSTHIPDYILVVELREKFHLSRDLLCELFVSGVQRDSLDGV